jgi:hypothetical protein
MIDDGHNFALELLLITGLSNRDIQQGGLGFPLAHSLLQGVKQTSEKPFNFNVRKEASVLCF